MRSWTVPTLVVCFLFLSSAEASTFQGNALATFSMPSPLPPAPQITNGTWADPTSIFKCGVPVSGSKKNDFEMTGKVFDAAPEAIFPIADMYYYNGSILGNGQKIILPTDLELKFTTPFADTKTFSFHLDFLFTPNKTGNPVKDADIMTPQDVFASQTFAYDGVTYTLKLEGFSSDGGVTVKDKFVLPERQDTTSVLYAKLTRYFPPHCVPEPASLAIWSLVGVMGLAYAGWRRARA